jgi:hypothetical protein
MSRPLLAARLLLALRVLVLALLVLAVFWSVAFGLLLLTDWLRGLPVAGAGLLTRGAVCGLIAALFVAVFHIRKEVIRLPVTKRDAFLDRVRVQLSDLGYTARAETPDRLVFRPAFRAVLFGANIQVEVAGTTATVTGPKVYLEMLRRRLRVESYLEPVRRDFGVGPLPRRIERSMRVSPEKLHRVRNEVVGALRVEGADVVCHLSIMAQSKEGMRDTAVEEALREWLREHGIPVEIHKEGFAAPRPRRALPLLPELAGAC